jgi:hypothetical protein
MTNVAIVSAPVLDLVETPKRSPKVQIVFPKHAHGQEQFKRQAVSTKRWPAARCRDWSTGRCLNP